MTKQDLFNFELFNNSFTIEFRKEIVDIINSDERFLNFSIKSLNYYLFLLYIQFTQSSLYNYGCINFESKMLDIIKYKDYFYNILKIVYFIEYNECTVKDLLHDLIIESVKSRYNACKHILLINYIRNLNYDKYLVHTEKIYYNTNKILSDIMREVYLMICNKKRLNLDLINDERDYVSEYLDTGGINF